MPDRENTVAVSAPHRFALRRARNDIVFLLIDQPDFVVHQT
jgi:hypothetical protein